LQCRLCAFWRRVQARLRDRAVGGAIFFFIEAIHLDWNDLIDIAVIGPGLRQIENAFPLAIEHAETISRRGPRLEAEGQSLHY
jgi:hypothetical protein